MNYSSSTHPSEIRPRIVVIGVGGAGGNAVNNMILSQLEGVEFAAANTDSQALSQLLVPRDRFIQLGLEVTQGLGAGSKPDVGRAAAEESIEEITRFISGSNMLFITAGMGGGTGTGAAPVIARIARENGILTVGVVTKPFHFEGAHRMRTADAGIDELQKYVDTLIIIPNQNLFRLANERTTFADAFKMADDVLHAGVRGVTDLMIMPGLINLDFADIRAIMSEMGKAMMGTGEASDDDGNTEGRALRAAELAISNPLLDDVCMKGAKGILINITGGYDMTLYEVDEAVNCIRRSSGEDENGNVNIIFGSTFDERLNGKIRVSVVATGIGQDESMTSAKQQLAKEASTSNSLSDADDILESLQKASQDPYVLGNNSERFEKSEDELGSSESSQTSRFTHDTFPAYDKNHALKEEVKKKKTPSLFERFSLGKKHTAQSHHSLSQEFSKSHEDSTSNASDDDDQFLDIPAFMRRKK